MEEVEEGALPLLFTRFGRLAQLCLPGDGRREGEVEQQTCGCEELARYG